jgi:GNAT superfamily N-acetyltransferase
VVLRPLAPADKQLLLDGLARLSPRSSYLRFLGVRRSLNPRELRYLTEIDGVDHFALCAVVQRPDGAEEGIGVARFIRLPGEPTVAEPAITVVDAHQGQGLGGLLLRRLVQAARERGVRRFRCQFLADNERVRALLDDLGPAVELARPDDQTVTAEFVLPRPALGERLSAAIRGSGMYRVLAHAARGRAEEALQDPRG